MPKSAFMVISNTVFGGSTATSASSNQRSTGTTYSEVTGTNREVPNSPRSPAAATPEQRALAWLSGAEARAYEGKWVALNTSGPDVRVEDSGDSPSILPQGPEVIVAFVLPAGMKIG